MRNVPSVVLKDGPEQELATEAMSDPSWKYARIDLKIDMFHHIHKLTAAFVVQQKLSRRLATEGDSQKNHRLNHLYPMEKSDFEV